MSVDLTVLRASQSRSVPSDEDFQKWAEACFLPGVRNNAITVRTIDEAESQQLNSTYRDKQSPTNVLSFPSGLPEQVQLEMESESGLFLLGDLVICAPVIEAEAKQQHKRTADHWAHMVVHGILHLLGHDHLEEVQALEMETLEKAILLRLGISDPYELR